MLRSADRVRPVADVARACGFQNAGHFAKEYREAFGEPPSETAARVRKRMLSPKRIGI